MRRFFSMLLFAFTVSSVLSYPITPQTLRKLIERSQLIVIAIVDKPDPLGEELNYFDTVKKEIVISYSVKLGGDGIAGLNILEILKGSPQNYQHVAVRYEAGMICPAPAVYPDKKTVIAFLRKEDTSDIYYTEGLSYGSKIIYIEEELNVYKARISEYLEILKIRGKHKRTNATVEWLTKCAENKYTRWDGAYELSRGTGFMSYYDHSKDPEFAKKLTKNQLKRLDSAFFTTEKVGQGELSLSRLIAVSKYPQLKEHLLKSLAFSSDYLISDILQRITEIYPNAELISIYEEADSLSYNDVEKEAKQKQLVEKFIEVASPL